MNKRYALAVDCRLAASTGIGRYVREIVPHLADRFGASRLLLIGRTGGLAWAAPWIGAGAAIIDSDAALFRREEQRLYAEVGRNCDLLWLPHFNVPLRRVGRLAVTVHDLIPLHVAVGWKGWVRRWGARVYLRAVRRHADLVLTVSNRVAGELRQELGVEEERIRAIHNGVEARWFEQARQRMMEGRYIIYVGNISPHKNVEALFTAFMALQDKVSHALVVVGEERGFTSRGIMRIWSKKLGRRLRHVSRVSEEDLRAWVAGADLLVQPSREEGFGLPPLEAMAAGCPVLTSDCAALLETAAEGAHRFRLGVEGDCESVLGRLLTDDTLRRSKVLEGCRWARKFSWESTGKQVAQELYALWERNREVGGKG